MSNEDIQEQMKKHQKIFISLVILTLVSVGIAMSGIGGGIGIIIALGIGFTQGALILGNLMHLKESSSMKGLMSLTIFFVAYLLFATWMAYTDHIEGTDLVQYTPAAVAQEEHVD
jgi:caa(3)-type oxidase subunit IV